MTKIKPTQKSSQKDYHAYTKNRIHQSTEELTKTKIKYGSASYSVLCYAAMKSRFADKTFTVEDIMYVLAGKLNRPSDTKRKIKVLTENNCIEQVSPNRWQITDFGLETRRIFGWYGRTMASVRMERRKADNRIPPPDWEDEI